MEFDVDLLTAFIAVCASPAVLIEREERFLKRTAEWITHHPKLVLATVFVIGFVMTVLAGQFSEDSKTTTTSDALREIGGALIAGAVIGGAILLYEEGADAKRDVSAANREAQHVRNTDRLENWRLLGNEAIALTEETALLSAEAEMLAAHTFEEHSLGGAEVRKLARRAGELRSKHTFQISPLLVRVGDTAGDEIESALTVHFQHVLDELDRISATEIDASGPRLYDAWNEVFLLVERGYRRFYKSLDPDKGSDHLRVRSNEQGITPG